jgi:hypothetical protein
MMWVCVGLLVCVLLVGTHTHEQNEEKAPNLKEAVQSIKNGK